MFNKIIGINSYQLNFLKAIKTVSTLILKIHQYNDITHILNAIKNNTFEQEDYFCNEQGIPADLSVVWQTLLTLTPTEQDKKILTIYINTHYDHTMEKSVSEWIIFSLMRGHWPIYRNIKTLVDTGKIKEAEQILTLHKKAVVLSKMIIRINGTKNLSKLNKNDTGTLILSRAFLAYKINIPDLEKFINDATSFLKRHQ